VPRLLPWCGSWMGHRRHPHGHAVQFAQPDPDGDGRSQCCVCFTLPGTDAHDMAAQSDPKKSAASQLALPVELSTGFASANRVLEPSTRRGEARAGMIGSIRSTEVSEVFLSNRIHAAQHRATALVLGADCWG
jgi:hypothetical protein